jgi:hypothetical protein
VLVVSEGAGDWVKFIKAAPLGTNPQVALRVFNNGSNISVAQVVGGPVRVDKL